MTRVDANASLFSKLCVIKENSVVEAAYLKLLPCSSFELVRFLLPCCLKSFDTGKCWLQAPGTGESQGRKGTGDKGAGDRHFCKGTGDRHFSGGTEAPGTDTCLTLSGVLA